MVAAVVLGLVGLLVGPVLGVIVDRAVQRERLQPHHRCTACRSPMGGRSMVPVLSWFGRCAACGRHPGWRYPVTDLAAVGALAVVGGRFGFDWPTVAYAALAAVLVVLSVIDVETHLLPDVITFPALLGGLALVVALSVAGGTTDRIPGALVGAATAFGILLVLHVAMPAGLGFGDVKLAPTLGLFIGWLYPSLLTGVSLVLYTLLIASAAGGLLGVAVNLVRRRRAEFPFGPALAGATMTVIAFAPRLVPPS
jgi:leader peptidase (prepilin peptidase) / N-methyltransferase